MPNLMRAHARARRFFVSFVFFLRAAGRSRTRAGRPRGPALSAHPRIISPPRRGEDCGDGPLVCPHAGPHSMKAPGETTGAARRRKKIARRARARARSAAVGGSTDPDVRGGSRQTRSKMPSKPGRPWRVKSQQLLPPKHRLPAFCTERGLGCPAPSYHMSHDTISIDWRSISIPSIDAPAAVFGALALRRSRGAPRPIETHRAPRALLARRRARGAAAGAASGRSRAARGVNRARGWLFSARASIGPLKSANASARHCQDVIIPHPAVIASSHPLF